MSRWTIFFSWAACRPWAGLNGDVKGVLELERTGFDTSVEAFAFEKGHRDESAAIGLGNLVDGADVGMVQGSGGFRFPLEALADVLVGNEMRGQELQGNGAIEGCVLGFVDDAHAAFTELLSNAVMGDGLADHVGPILPLKLRMAKQLNP